MIKVSFKMAKYRSPYDQ